MGWQGPRQSKVNYRFGRKHGQRKFPLVQKKRGGKVVPRRSRIKILGLPVKARRRAVVVRRRRT